MNVRDGKLANGTQVEQVNCDANSYSQNFQYVDGQLRLAGKNLCVDIKEHRNVDGGWYSHLGVQQCFEVAKVGVHLCGPIP